MPSRDGNGQRGNGIATKLPAHAWRISQPVLDEVRGLLNEVIEEMASVLPDVEQHDTLTAMQIREWSRDLRQIAG